MTAVSYIALARARKLLDNPATTEQEFLQTLGAISRIPASPELRAQFNQIIDELLAELPPDAAARVRAVL